MLAIPAKRSEKRIVTFLTPEEVKALLDSPDRSTWAGRRDHALLLTAVQTGLRVSELIGLTNADVHLGTAPHLRTFGKGRKERVAPLTRQTSRHYSLDARARRLPGRPAVPNPDRQATDPRRDRATPCQACRRRGTPVFNSALQARHAARLCRSDR